MFVGSNVKHVAAEDMRPTGRLRCEATMTPIPMVKTTVRKSVLVVERTLRILVHSDHIKAPNRYVGVVGAGKVVVMMVI